MVSNVADLIGLDRSRVGHRRKLIVGATLDHVVDEEVDVVQRRRAQGWGSEDEEDKEDEMCSHCSLPRR